MRKKQVWRYFCEFCKKSGCSGGHLRRHEETCTANPARACRMCRPGVAVLDPPTAKLVAILTEPGENTTEAWEEKMERLRDLAQECPACILAAIRQSGVQKKSDQDEPGGSPEDPMYWSTAMANGATCLGFHFKNERDAYLHEANLANQQYDR